MLTMLTSATANMAPVCSPVSQEGIIDQSAGHDAFLCYVEIVNTKT